MYKEIENIHLSGRDRKLRKRNKTHIVVDYGVGDDELTSFHLSFDDLPQSQIKAINDVQSVSEPDRLPAESYLHNRF